MEQTKKQNKTNTYTLKAMKAYQERQRAKDPEAFRLYCNQKVRESQQRKKLRLQMENDVDNQMKALNKEQLIYLKNKLEYYMEGTSLST